MFFRLNCFFKLILHFYINIIFDYLFNIFQAIILFICFFCENKFINSKAFFKFLKSFFNNKILFENFVLFRELREIINMQLNQKLDIINDESYKEFFQKKSIFLRNLLILSILTTLKVMK